MLVEKLNRLMPQSRMEALEDEVSMVKRVVHTLLKDVAELKA